MREDISLGSEDGEAVLGREESCEAGEAVGVEVAEGVVVEEELRGHLVHAAGHGADEGGGVLLLLVAEGRVRDLRLLLVVAAERCHVAQQRGVAEQVGEDAADLADALLCEGDGDGEEAEEGVGEVGAAGQARRQTLSLRMRRGTRHDAECDEDGTLALVADERGQQRGAVLHRVVVLRGQREEQLQLRLTPPAETHLVHVAHGNHAVQAVQRRRGEHVLLAVMHNKEPTLIGAHGPLPLSMAWKSVSTWLRTAAGACALSTTSFMQEGV